MRTSTDALRGADAGLRNAGRCPVPGCARPHLQADGFGGFEHEPIPNIRVREICRAASEGGLRRALLNENAFFVDAKQSQTLRSLLDEPALRRRVLADCSQLRWKHLLGPEGWLVVLRCKLAQTDAQHLPFMSYDLHSERLC